MLKDKNMHVGNSEFICEKTSFKQFSIPLFQYFPFPIGTMLLNFGVFNRLLLSFGKNFLKFSFELSLNIVSKYPLRHYEESGTLMPIAEFGLLYL